MNIDKILTPSCILTRQDCQSKKDVLDTLAGVIANSDNTISQTEVFDCLIAREKLGSTGLGNGIAIPHGRLSHEEKTIAAFLQLKHGIDYDAIDKKPVNLFFALIVPEKSTEEHLHILAKLAEMLGNKHLLQKLRISRSANDIYAALTS